MSPAEVLTALSRLAWPVLAGIVLWRACPALFRAISKRGFTIEVGCTRLTVQEATDLLRMQLYDLQEHVTGLRKINGGGALVSLWPKPDPARVAPRRLVWFDPDPDCAAHETGILRCNGLEVQQVQEMEKALAALEGDSAADLVVVSRMAAPPSPLKAERLLDAVRLLAGRGAGRPVVVYADPRTVNEHREEFLRAGAATAIHSPIGLYESLEAAPRAATAEFEWERGTP